MTKPFTNPYQGIEKTGYGPTGGARRLACDIPTEIHTDIFRIRITKIGGGTLSTVVNLLLKKFHDELKRRNITDATKCAEFEHFAANSVLAMPDELNAYYATRGPISGHVPPSDAPNDGRGTEGVHGGPTNPPNEHADAKSANGTKQKRRGTKATQSIG